MGYCPCDVNREKGGDSTLCDVNRERDRDIPLSCDINREKGGDIPLCDAYREKVVSKLVFYAQSTGAVISGRTGRSKGILPFAM